jgi:hypothetical protein
MRGTLQQYPVGYPDGMSTCGPAGTPDTCATHMGLIHLQAGDLVSAYRFFLPMAEQGDADAIDRLIEICERAGDAPRAESWRTRPPAA